MNCDFFVEMFQQIWHKKCKIIGVYFTRKYNFSLSIISRLIECYLLIVKFVSMAIYFYCFILFSSGYKYSLVFMFSIHC